MPERVPSKQPPTVSSKRSVTSHNDVSPAIKRRVDTGSRSAFDHGATYQYKLLEVLEQGSFGIVTKVERQSDPPKIYARKQLALRKSRPENIKKEVDLIRKLHHQHIVQVIDTYSDDAGEWYYIVLEPAADYDLRKYLQDVISHPSSASERRRFGQQRLALLRWMSCLAAALCYIHSVRVRHRDIKPENILIHGDNILFTDFGTSYHSEQDTRYTGTRTPGTSKYMPPEASHGRRFGRRGDIFSLGCVFWEMTEALSGPILNKALPDIGSGSYASGMAYDKIVANLDKIKENRTLKHRLSEAVRFSDDFPRSLLLLISNMLNPAPQDRRTAEAVVDAFNHILEESGSSPAPCCSPRYKQVSAEPKPLNTCSRSALQAVIGPDASKELLLVLTPLSVMSLLVGVAAAHKGTGTTIVIIPTVVPRGDLVSRLVDLGLHYLVWAPGETRAAPFVFMSAEAIFTDDFRKYAQHLISEKRLDRIIINDCDRSMTVGYRTVNSQVRQVQAQTQTVWVATTLAPNEEKHLISAYFLTEPDIIRQSLNRQNIRYSIQTCETSSGLFESAEKLIRSCIAMMHGADGASRASENHTTSNSEKSRAIVYCRESELMEELADQLSCPKYDANPGCLSREERDAAIEQWLAPTGSPVIIIADDASSHAYFGIDYPHVRRVIHVGEPYSMETFWRQSGQAGRDGELAESIILTSTVWQRRPISWLANPGRLHMELYLSQLSCLRAVMSLFIDAAPNWRWCMDGEDELCSECPVHHTHRLPANLKLSLR